jgi:hypothetical protein
MEAGPSRRDIFMYKVRLQKLNTCAGMEMCCNVSELCGTPLAVGRVVRCVCVRGDVEQGGTFSALREPCQAAWAERTEWSHVSASSSIH